MRLPVHAGDLLNQVSKARGRLETRLGRGPSTAELAAELAVPEARVADVLRYSLEPMSLSEPLRADGDLELGDVVEDHTVTAPFEAAATALLAGEVAKMLTTLDPRESEILRLRFGLDRGVPRTLDEIGARFDLTRERIRQLEAKALSKLRHPTVYRSAHELLSD